MSRDSEWAFSKPVILRQLVCCSKCTTATDPKERFSSEIFCVVRRGWNLVFALRATSQTLDLESNLEPRLSIGHFPWNLRSPHVASFPVAEAKDSRRVDEPRQQDPELETLAAT